MSGDRTLLLVLFEMILLVLLGPLVTGIIQKLKARLQSRQGAGVIQPYYDLIKLLNRGRCKRTRPRVCTVRFRCWC